MNLGHGVQESQVEEPAGHITHKRARPFVVRTLQSPAHQGRPQPPVVSASYRSSSRSASTSRFGSNAEVLGTNAGTRQWRSWVASVIMGAEGALFSLLSREQELSLLLPASSSVESNVTGEGEGDVRAVLAEGSRNRRTASHALNADSSRSHSLLTLHVLGTYGGGGGGGGGGSDLCGAFRVRCQSTTFVTNS